MSRGLDWEDKWTRWRQAAAAVTVGGMLSSGAVVGCETHSCVQAAWDRASTSLIGTTDDTKVEMLFPGDPVVVTGVGDQIVVPDTIRASATLLTPTMLP